MACGLARRRSVTSSEITHHRTVGRFTETDPRRWQREDFLAMRVTLWYIKETA